MSATTEDLDLKRYGRLLARAAPKVIKTEEENERAGRIARARGGAQEVRQDLRARIGS